MRVLLATVLFLGVIRCAVAGETGQGVLREPESAPDMAVGEGDLSDREPVDPAEQRPAVIPPARIDALREARPDGIIILPPIWSALGPAPTPGSWPARRPAWRTRRAPAAICPRHRAA